MLVWLSEEEGRMVAEVLASHSAGLWAQSLALARQHESVRARLLQERSWRANSLADRLRAAPPAVPHRIVETAWGVPGFRCEIGWSVSALEKE